MKRVAVVLLAGVLGVWWCGGGDETTPDLRLGTFNIENFPQSRGQVEGAFESIAELELDVVGLQEILDPVVAVSAARQRLGEHWRGAFCRECPELKVGVIYNSSRVELTLQRDHPGLAIYPSARPAFEARFLVDGGRPLRLFVVHLKAGGDGSAVRERQLHALRPLLAAAVASGDRVAVLGDFNATNDADRASIAEMAAATTLHWASRELPCTCYWQRRESCFGATLDHVLTSSAPRQTVVGGACAESCQPGGQCPTYRSQVSDHCPVRVDLTN